MRYVIVLAGALLAALAACATDANTDEAPTTDAGHDSDGGEGGVDSGESDSAPPDAGAPDADAGVERPLACGDAGFCETRLPSSDLGLPLSLRGVWAAGPSDVWSVTLEGQILHYDGATWTTAYRANHELYAVWSAGNAVFAGGEGGLLLRRTADGVWSRIETGHAAPIRSIRGMSENDVWSSSRVGFVDHFDGTSLTTRALPVVDLELTTIFGDAVHGVFAAGRVEGAAEPWGGEVPHEPHVLRLTTSAITTFNAQVPTVTGFVPVSGLLTSSAEDAPSIFLSGYFELVEDDGFGSRNAIYLAQSVRLDPESAPARMDVGLEVYAMPMGSQPPPSLLGRGREANRVELLYGTNRLYRWNGRGFSTDTLGMGAQVVPRLIFGVHDDTTATWIVGDGFALKGPTL